MDARVKRIVEIVDQSFAERLSEASLSGNVNLSAGRLRQLFKDELGVSPMQYIRAVRMKNAVKLLRTSFLSIKQVIFKSGWRDGSHFMRQFKRQYGVTPSEFRARSQRSPKQPQRSRGTGE
jgi:AraC-like DNA-binding protein